MSNPVRIGGCDDLRGTALALYVPPFRYEQGYVWDANGQMVADNPTEDGAAVRIRGWGRIGYMPEPHKLQDRVGELIADAMTYFWHRETADIAHFKDPKVDGVVFQFAAIVRKAVERMTWKPIATADRSGIPILLLSREGARSGRYWNQLLAVRGNPNDVRHVEWVSLNGSYEEVVDPTHWMQEPDDPSTELAA